MSTRTTPYGLFSGINIGYFDNHSNIELNDILRFKKRTRPDMEWLYGVINSAERDKNFVKCIRIKKNSLSYQKGDRLENPFISNLGLFNKKEGDVIITSIRCTNLLDLVMKHTQEFIEFAELENIISEKYPNVKGDKIYNYLQELLRYEYLISELRPPLTEIQPFEYVKNKLESISSTSQFKKQFTSIDNNMKIYNAQPIGRGVQILSDITSSMLELNSESMHILQTDMAISTKENILNKCIGKDIEKYCEMLEKIQLKKFESDSMKSYREEFIEKYGSSVEVQLIELLDEDIGLGAPVGYQNSRSQKRYEQNSSENKIKKFESLIKYKIIEANISNSFVIKLTDEEIDQISNEGDMLLDEDLSPSLELNVIVSAKNCQDIDKGKYSLFIGPNIGSIKAGKSFGRFMDILPEDDAQHIKSKIYVKERDVIKDKYIMAEISEILQVGRGNNVTINSNNLEYEICIATNSSSRKKTLDIKDLYIGVSNNRFYIRSKSLDKKIFVTYHHMMNHKNGSNLCRFLKEVTFSYYLNIIDAAMAFGFVDFDHIPRLMYDKIVITPATWRIKKEIFDLSSYKKFEEAFDKWVDEYRLPRYIYQKEYDNRLMLDLNSPIHKKELFNIIRKSSDTIVLTETEIGEELDRLIVSGKDSTKYCSELVIPLIRKASKDKKEENKLVMDSIKTKSFVLQNMDRTSFQDIKRNLFPGDENWYYYKLYVSSTRIDELIGDFLYEFCEMLVEKSLISKYFFLRYADPKGHVRLRLQGTGENGYLVHKNLDKLLKKLRSKGLVYHLQTENYIRELERYGGQEIIQDAESYFYADSQFVGRLIKTIRDKDINYEKIQIGITSIISIMEDFNVSIDDQEKLFSSIVDRKSHREYYNKNRKKYMQYADWNAICNKQISEDLYDLLMEKKERTINFREAVDYLDESGLLCNKKENILLSMIHMFCNRFVGDRNWEELVTALIRHSLHDLKSYKEALRKLKVKGA